MIKVARINFVELPAKDVSAARAFYQKLFACSCTMTGDVDLGLQGDPSEAPSAPLPVVVVDDLEAAQTAVLSAGGAVTKGIFSFPGGRRFQFTDPNGLELAIMQEG